jgi:hypothetical protein
MAAQGMRGVLSFMTWTRRQRPMNLVSAARR